MSPPPPLLGATEFDEPVFYRLWSDRFDPETTADQIDGIRAIFDRHGISSGSSTRPRVLDICGGNGRIALPLAMYGFDVTLVDVSEGMLAHARERVARANAGRAGPALPVHCLAADVRTLELDHPVDAAVMVFQSFGYFDTDDEHVQAMERIGQALRPRGLFVFDLIHRDFAATVDALRTWHHGPDGAPVLHTWRFDPIAGRSTESVATFDPPAQREWQLRIFNLTELRDLLAAGGMEVVETFADYGGEPFRLDGPGLVVVARKSG